MAADENILTAEQGLLLVRIARERLTEKLGRPAESLSETVVENIMGPFFHVRRGVFVTLKKRGQLRGCIGTLSGQESIVQGVRTHAVNAAFHDPRFSPLSFDELDQIHLEVSVLTEPQRLEYHNCDDLVASLRPHVDGVILRKGHAGATYLPQVWDQLPDPSEFLSSLCQKAGLAADTWRRKAMTVETYQVQYFEEA